MNVGPDGAVALLAGVTIYRLPQLQMLLRLSKRLPHNGQSHRSMAGAICNEIASQVVIQAFTACLEKTVARTSRIKQTTF